MPIHVLKVETKPSTGTEEYDFNKVLEWTEEYVKAKDYALIVTDENEIILEPRKSTRPLDFGYINIKNTNAIKTLAGMLEKLYGLKRIEVKSLGWDVEKPPWVKVPVE
jgi:hypothetical protein